MTRLLEGHFVSATPIRPVPNWPAAGKGPVKVPSSGQERNARETVHRIGEIKAGPRGCTVRGSAESWSAREDWTITHNA